LIVVVVVLGYGIGPNRLPLIGDETCRAQHGIEMAQTGDWVIARQQGVLIQDRPPGQYWTLGLIHRFIHPLDALTLRLSMAAMTLATALLIWWYSKRFLSVAGAFLAGVAYPTMGHVFDLGRRAETDGQYTLFIGAALLVWHYGYTYWRPQWTWLAACTIASAATLIKGTQGPITFFGAVYLFLLVRRDRRFALHWSHFLGIALFLAPIVAWQVPLYRELGWWGTRQTWFTPTTSRLSLDAEWLAHVIKFPFKVLAASLPWSVLLVGLFHRRFWRLVPKNRSSVLFMFLGMVAVFVPVWLVTGGKTRYSMSMYPMMAVVCGTVAMQCLACEPACSLRRLWKRFFRVWVVVLTGAIAVLLTVTIRPALADADKLRVLVQPWPLMLILIAWSLASLGLVLRYTKATDQRSALICTFALASLVAVCFNGPVHNANAMTTARVGPDVIAVRESLPPDKQLVSFGPLHQHFVYWYEDAIPVLDPPATVAQVSDEVDWFAVNEVGGEMISLPFPWEPITRISMDPKRTPEIVVVIGRRNSIPIE
jgi:4-amino-4-deoxy-L-arabinose transferase-like glycosyltransferase